MDTQDFERLKTYIGFSPETEASLKEFQAKAEPHLASIAQGFSERIASHPDTRLVLTGGEEQLDKLRHTLLAWLQGVLFGPHDQNFLEAQARVGRVHVRVGLPQRYLVGAMNQLRVELRAVAEHAYAAAPEISRRVRSSIDQVLDLSLAILLDAYSEHLQDKLRATERLAIIGQLAASIGHELRNPLGTIEASLFLINQRLKRIDLEDSVLDKHHERIRKQLGHCGSVITNLLNLARDRSPQRVHSSALDLVRRALDLVTIPHEIELEIDIPANLSIYADPEDMMHVLMNLLTNAIQAQPEGGRICVSGQASDTGTELRVADNGPGVPAEIRAQIFEPLFTTKSRGTGLGLALCRRVLAAHGGEIQLEPTRAGASFRVWVPAESARA